jgi:UDP-N-acetylmuramoyl-tripeptide--D-alanyl-D-alanine ligase
MCGGVLHAASPARTVRRISKDTRTLIPGDLYLALHGENHDGNIYAKDAAERAAAAILDAAPADLPAGFSVILVDDTLAALHRLAAAWRDRLALKVACVTGSSGKPAPRSSPQAFCPFATVW